MKNFLLIVTVIITMMISQPILAASINLAGDWNYSHTLCETCANRNTDGICIGESHFFRYKISKGKRVKYYFDEKNFSASLKDKKACSVQSSGTYYITRSRYRAFMLNINNLELRIVDGTTKSFCKVKPANYDFARVEMDTNKNQLMLWSDTHLLTTSTYTHKPYSSCNKGNHPRLIQVYKRKGLKNRR